MRIRQLRPLIIASGVMVIVIMILAIILVNQQIAASRLSAQIAREEQELSKSAKDAAANKTLGQDYNQLSTKLGGRFKEVSWSSRMPFMINQLTGIMESHDLKVDTLKPDPLTKVDGVSRLPLRISLKADLGKLAKVVRDIEKGFPLLKIDSLDIRTAAGSAVLQTDMTVSSFAVTDKNAPEAPAISLTPKTPKKAPAKPKTAADDGKAAQQGKGEK